MLVNNNPKVSFWIQKRTLIAYAVSLLALAEIVDLTIVAVAIPQVMGSLGANLNTIAEITTTYIVAAAVFILLSGLVIEKYGMRRVILASAALFGVSSILCGMATSLEEMVIFRLLQGIGGAFLPSVAQAYISTHYTEKQEYNKMMGVYSLVVVMGPILGPVLGGGICENLSWRWVFYVNVPICLVAYAIIFFLMKKQEIKNVKIDYISFLFMGVGVGCLELFVDNGNSNGWFQSIEIIILLVVAIICIGFFIWRGIVHTSVIKLRVLLNKNLILCCFLIFMFLVLFSAALAYFPTMLQNIYGWPVDTAGYITAPRGIISAVMAIVCQAYLVKKLGQRLTMSVGIFIFACGCLLQSTFSVNITDELIICSTMMQGAGMMMFFISIMQIVTYGVAEEDMGDMSGIVNFFRNFGSSVGTAIAATTLSRLQQTNQHELSQHISNYESGFTNWVHSGVLGNNPKVYAVASQEIIKFQGGLLSFIDLFYMVGIGAVLLAIIPYFLKESKGH